MSFYVANHPFSAEMAMRIWSLMFFWVAVAELVINSVIHFGYGAYIFSMAVSMDFAEILQKHWLSRSRVWEYVARWSYESNLVNSDCAKDVANGPFFEGFEVAPIVLVHGIFGFGKGKLAGMSYFAGAETKDDHIFVPDLGSLTSVYDRARELFYYLKGGTVDYGEEHSTHFGHARFGKTYEQGHYPEWDEDHPVHFVGHSAGAQVVRILQQMLHDKQFIGHEDASERWILSLTSLSGALNGTTRVWMDGIRLEGGKTLKTVCLFQFCRVGVIITDWLDIAWFKHYYNFGFDHFHMTWRKVGFSGLIDALRGKSGPFAMEDWIMPDLVIQTSMKLNKTLQTFPQTYYFSYATIKTRKFCGMTVPSGLFGIHPLFFLRTLQMTNWRYPNGIPLPYEGYRDEDWQDNDGALNTISQLYPLSPEPHPHCWLGPDFTDGQYLQPGVWYFTILEADHIFFIVNRERAGVQFDVLYDSIFQRCRKHFIANIVPHDKESVAACTGRDKCTCHYSIYDHRTRSSCDMGRRQ